MGNAFGGYLEVGAPKKQGTTLIQLNIHHMRDAHDIMGQRPDEYFTPVTLVPQAAMSSLCCVPLCYVAVPAGMTAIVTRFGAVVEGNEEDGTWSPGCHCFNPLNQVDKLVSKQLICFDTPVQGCKTKDMITVNIDVMIQFEITAARDFVYKIGPEKFDDFLRASEDECLRKLCFETLVENIYDLHGKHEEAVTIVEELNAKFSKYGVKVHQFNVKHVSIPPKMATEFQEKTLFESKTVEQRAKQTLDKLELNNEEGKQKLREECDNKRMACEQQAVVDENKAIKEVSGVVSKTSRDIEELEAQRDNEVKKVTTSAELEISKMKSEILAMEREQKSNIEAECADIRNKADAYAAKVDADRTVEDARKLASGHKSLAAAEGEASAAFAARRAHEAELKRLEILQHLTQREGAQIHTSQENTVGMSADNAAVTQVAQQGLEALRAKLAEVTATSLARIQEVRPSQQRM